MYICIYVTMYVCMYVYIYIYIHMCCDVCFVSISFSCYLFRFATTSPALGFGVRGGGWGKQRYPLLFGVFGLRALGCLGF